MSAHAEQAKQRRRRLRREQTLAERRLWLALRDRRLFGTKFRRQHPVGSYVVDFCCPERHLIIELDGGQHATRVEEDLRRTAFLEARAFRVLRFWDNDVLSNTDGVLQRVAGASTGPHPGPLPGRERG